LLHLVQRSRRPFAAIKPSGLAAFEAIRPGQRREFRTRQPHFTRIAQSANITKTLIPLKKDVPWDRSSSRSSWSRLACSQCNQAGAVHVHQQDNFPLACHSVVAGFSITLDGID
jgi:hypothetical protein